jgi:hypothetical protein
VAVPMGLFGAGAMNSGVRVDWLIGKATKTLFLHI